MPTQDVDVIDPGAQRRDLQREYANSEVQVFAKTSVPDRLFKSPVGSGDESKIKRDFLVRADPFDNALLQNPEQFGLQFGRHFANFVQKQRTSVGELKLAGLAFLGASKGAAFVAKQGGFEEVFGDRSAIDCNEWSASALGVRVDVAGKNFFAGAGFATQQHREFAGGNTSQAREHLQKGGVFADGA